MHILKNNHYHDLDQGAACHFSIRLMNIVPKSNVPFIGVLASSRPFYMKHKIIFLATLSSLYLMLTSKAS